MPTDKTPSTVRGLLVPDPRFKFSTFSETDSTYTENTSRPGVPEAAQSSDATHETSGEMANLDLKIYTQSPGFPGTDSGTFLWYNTDDTETHKYQGYEPPKTISGMEVVDAYDAAEDDFYRVPDTITADDGSVIVAAVRARFTPSTDSGAPLKIWRKTAGGAWTETAIEDDTDLEPGIEIESANWPGPGPALVKVPDGRLLLFYWIHMGTQYSGSDSKQTWQVRALYSADHGANWAVHQEFCLVDPLVQLSYTDTFTDGGRYYPGRLRAAYAGGQIVLFSSMIDTSSVTTGGQPNGGRPIHGQWASSDLGSSFVTIEIAERHNTKGKTALDVVGYRDGFVAFYGEGSSGANMSTVSLGSAFQKLSEGTARLIDVIDPECAHARAAVGTEDYFEFFDVALAASPDGVLYIVYNPPTWGATTANENWHKTRMIYSTDGGSTWGLSGATYFDNATDFRKEGSGCVFRSTIGEYDTPTENTSTHVRERITDFAMTWQHGRMVVICKYRRTDPSAPQGYQDAGKSTGLLQEPIYALFLGGYTNVTMGSCLGTVQMRQRANWCKQYLPFVAPADMGSDTYNHNWTQTASGVSTAAVVQSQEPYLKLTTGDGASNTGARYFTGTTDFDAGVSATTTNSGSRTHVEIAVDPVQGGSKFGEGIAVKIRNGTATLAEYVSIRFERTASTVNLHLWDIQGAAVFLSTIDLDTHGIKDFPELRVLIHDQRIAIYGRKYDADAELREFKQLYHSASKNLRTGTAGGSRCSVEWGNIAVAGGTTQNISHWYKVATGSDDNDETPCAVPKIDDWLDYLSPRHVGGREFATVPLYIRQGLKMRTVDGPSKKADEWRIRPRYDYPIEVLNADVASSPRRTWRSKNTSSEMLLSWTLDDNEAAYFLGSTLGLYLGNINFRFFEIEGYDGSAWNTLASVDNSQPVKYLRQGNMVKPDPSNTTDATASQHFLTYGSLTGSTFDFAGAGNTPQPHRIETNSEGVFSAQTTKQPTLRIDGDVSSYAASGTGAIWANEIAVLIHGVEAVKYQKIRIKIPTAVGGVTNSTADGFFEIGVAVFGHVAGFGRQYSFGHKREIETNVEIDTSAGGFRTATKLGPARRRVSLSWKDPIDLSGMMGTQPAPDYIKSSDAAGKGILASVSDTPFLLQGLIEAIDGGATPVVFLPAIPTASAQTSVILNPHQMLYGRVTSKRQQIENEFGDEWAGNDTGEVATATTIRIEEEV